MGKKIHPTRFRQANYYYDIENTKSPLTFRNRFLQEIEIRSFLSKTLQQQKLYIQQLHCEQSLHLGLLIRLNFTSIERLVAPADRPVNRGMANRIPFTGFKKKTIVSNRLVKSLLKDKKVTVCSTFKKSIATLHGQKTKLFKPFTIIAYSYLPYFLCNEEYIVFIKILYKILRRFQRNKHFFEILVLGSLALSVPGWLNIFMEILVKSLFRSRQHYIQLRYLRALSKGAFKSNRSLSKVRGICLQLAGRLDKKPRTQKYKIFLGKIEKQTIFGTLSSADLQTVTKNGTFGLFCLIRFLPHL